MPPGASLMNHFTTSRSPRAKLVEVGEAVHWTTAAVPLENSVQLVPSAGQAVPGAWEARNSVSLPAEYLKRRTSGEALAAFWLSKPQPLSVTVPEMVTGLRGQEIQATAAPPAVWV